MNEFYNTIDIKKLSTYLIKMYYQTECKYSCTRPKINRLLTIYVLCNLQNKPDLSTSFYVTDTYIGFIKHLPHLMHLDIYHCFDTISHTRNIEDEFKEIDWITKTGAKHLYYKELIDSLNNESMKLSQNEEELLEKIFRTFGAYPQTELSPMIDELKSFVPFKINKDETVSLNEEEFILFLESHQSRLQHNEAFNFIKKHYRLQEEKTVSIKKESQAKQDKELENRLLKLCENISKTKNKERLEELIKLLELVNKLAILENSDLESLVNKVRTKSKII